MRDIDKFCSIIIMINVIVNVMLMIVSVVLIQTAYTLNETIQQLEYEKKINAYTVDQFNKMSTKAKQYKDRVEELENANEAMMQHCTPSSIVRAIKATPLIPLVKEKNIQHRG